MLNRILVALDGSALAERTLPFATPVARAFDAEVVLLRVVELGDRASPGSLDSFDWRIGRAEAIQYLSKVKRDLQEQGIGVDIDVTAGRASDEILEIARARDVDLLVVGSHGAGGVTEFHMASTAQQVVSESDTSVLVVPAREGAEGASFTSVLVPVDGSPLSEWAVSISARLASHHKSDLVVLHVVTTPKLLEPSGSARETEIVEEIVGMNRRAAHRYLDGLRRRLDCPGLNIRTIVEVADEIAPVVERHARAEGQPLVVLNTRSQSRVETAFHGSLVTLMLANTAQPVLVLREGNHRERNRSEKRRTRHRGTRRQAAASL